MFNILINKMEPSGPEIISSHPPKTFSDEDLREISLKSIPLNAKDGEFSTFLFNEKTVIASYIFTIQKKENSRPNLYAICGALSPNELNPIHLKPVFASIIDQLKEFKELNTNTIVALTSKIFKTINDGKTEVKITKTTTLKIEIEKSELDKIKNHKKKRLNSTKNMW